MEMTINKLPAPTWNRLGMNESRISNITIDAAQKAQIQVPNVAITRKGTEIDWNSLNSGLGQDMDILGASIEADSFHVEKDTHENEPVVYRLQYQDNHTLWINNKAETLRFRGNVPNASSVNLLNSAPIASLRLYISTFGLL